MLRFWWRANSTQLSKALGRFLRLFTGLSALRGVQGLGCRDAAAGVGPPDFPNSPEVLRDYPQGAI